MLRTSPKSKILAPTSRPEKVVERYYPQLREWADVLTRGDQSRSEDIVHDLYLYVALTKPDLSQVENLDNYLYQSLRHAYLSALTRAARESMQTVTTADFDSIRVALWARPARDVLQQQNELRRICCYAVWRKEQMKGASYFVLRFFHGYGLQEVTSIAGLPLSAVKPKLSEARADVREYMTDSKSVRLVGRAAPPEPIQLWALVSWPSLSRELRAMILDGRTGECLSEWELALYYHSPVPKPVPTARLSHIVSCEKCLAAIDKFFGRPTLKDRESLDEVHGFDGNEGGGANRGRAHSSRRALLQRVEKHCEDLYQHRPETLSVAIDGKIVASHEVQAQRNVLSARAEKVNESTYVEVLSEQGLRLAMLWFDDLPPRGPHKKAQRTNLSEDRWIDLALTIDGQGLLAEVVYFAPELGLVPVADLSEEEQESAALLFEEAAGAAENPERVPLLLPGNHSIDPEKTDQKPKIGPRSLWLRSWLNEFMCAMNPLLTSAIVLGTVAVLCFVFWLRSAPTPSAGDLLDHAQKSERATTFLNRPGVIYEKVSIRSPRHTVERTIYRDAQGVRRLRRENLSPEDEQLKNNLASAGVNWDAPLSAAEFADWRYRSGATRDLVTSPSPHLLTLKTTPLSNGPVLWESLTVRDTDFHAVDRTVELRGSGTVEIAELNYDVLPWGAVNPDWFEPMVGQVASDMHATLHLSSLPSFAELDEVELTTRLRLHQAGADLGEDVRIERTENAVVVVGVVDSVERANALRAALTNVQYVKVHLISSDGRGHDGTLPEGNSHAIAAVQGVAKEPVQPLLIHWLRQRFSDDDTRSLYVTKLLHTADAAMWHANALESLAARYGDFTDDRVRLIANDHRAALSALIDSLYRDVQTFPGTVAQPVSPSLMRLATTLETTRNMKLQTTELNDALTLLLADHDLPVQSATGPDHVPLPKSEEKTVVKVQEQILEIQRLLRHIQ
jgi:DNA-directed RNA polymerase specialized sigma24 family protein